MGNRSGCSMFADERRDEEKYFLDGLTQSENLALKEIFQQMNITLTKIQKEVSMLEFKRNLDLQMVFMRKRKRISPAMDDLYEHIQMLLKKDINSRQRYRIGLNEFIVLWQNALHEKRLEDRRQWKDIKYRAGQTLNQFYDQEGNNNCLSCMICQKREKVDFDQFDRGNYDSHELGHPYDLRKSVTSDRVRPGRVGSEINYNDNSFTPLERSTLSTRHDMDGGRMSTLAAPAEAGYRSVH